MCKGMVKHVEPVNDPLFAAHQEISENLGFPADSTIAYISDETLSFVGCATQVNGPE
jgi:hypothetical protein